jgi:nucleotide-binding universal stress UspA family protein
MTAASAHRLPRQVREIFHPSDFSEASAIAFAHALKIALVTQARLSVLHVAPRDDVPWTDFPGIRTTLERWGLLPAGSARSAVGSLGIEVRKVLATHEDPVRASLAFLEAHPTDLIVLATHRRGERAGWLGSSVAEPIARGAEAMTLFVPHGIKGFISADDGSVSLRSILLPVDARPRPEPALEAARRAVWGLQCPEVAFTLLHVGAAGSMPMLKPEEQPGWTWEQVTREGDVLTTILETAAATSADLIVMATAGHNGFLDALRGSTTERVLRRAQCPLLAMPAGT